MSSTEVDAKDGPSSIIFQELRRLGAVPIESLVDCPAVEFEAFDLPFFANHIDVPTTLSTQEPEVAAAVLQENMSSSMHKLQQTCKQTFGNTNGLNFEFLEENGPDQKQCVLTITRPNGHTRSYKSEAIFKKKSDARNSVADTAVEMGAIDFIVHGNKSSNRMLVPVHEEYKKHLAEHVKLLECSTLVKDGQPAEVKVDEMSRQILEHCIEWRAGKVTPRWIFYTDPKTRRYGCATVVELTPHCQRVFSVGAIHDLPRDAQSACSQVAVDEGILEFIKFGNGQTTPTTIPAVDPLLPPVHAPVTTIKGTTTLQNFFDSLPKPFPERLELNKTATELNGPGLLNGILQMGKGSKLTSQFYSITEEFGKSRLFGSVLRVVSPDECLTYIVESMFAKKADAKAAVCFRALSQGLGEYVRNIAKRLDSRVTMDMKKKASDQILPVLISEYSRLRLGHPSYDYPYDQGAFGCTLTLKLSAEVSEGGTKQWSVAPEYRTKVDAKFALIFKYGEEAIVFVRFRGQPAPPDHDPLKPYRRDDGTKRGEPKSEAALREQDEDGSWRMGQSTRNGKGGFGNRNKQDNGMRGQRVRNQRSRDSFPQNSQYSGPSPYREQNTVASTSTSSAQYTYATAPAPAPVPATTSYSYPAYYAPPNPYAPAPPYDQPYAQPTAYYPPPPPPPPVAPMPPQPYPVGYPWPDPRYAYPPVPQPAYGYYPPPTVYTTLTTPYAYPPGPMDSSVSASAPPPASTPAPPATPLLPSEPVPPAPVTTPPPAPPSDPPPALAPAPPLVSATEATLVPPSAIAPPQPPTPQTSFPPAPMPAMQSTFMPPASFAPTVLPTPVPVPQPELTPSPIPASPPAPPFALVTPITPDSPNFPSQYSEAPVNAYEGSTPLRNFDSKQPRKKPLLAMRNADVDTGRNEGHKEWGQQKRRWPNQGESNMVNRKVKRSKPNAFRESKERRGNGDGDDVNVIALREFCASQGLPTPSFFHERISGDGPAEYKVWVILGGDKLELPTNYESISEGKERLAKQVLKRVRIQASTDHV